MVVSICCLKYCHHSGSHFIASEEMSPQAPGVHKATWWLGWSVNHLLAAEAVQPGLWFCDLPSPKGKFCEDGAGWKWGDREQALPSFLFWHFMQRRIPREIHGKLCQENPSAGVMILRGQSQGHLYFYHAPWVHFLGSSVLGPALPSTRTACMCSCSWTSWRNNWKQRLIHTNVDFRGNLGNISLLSKPRSGSTTWTVSVYRIKVKSHICTSYICKTQRNRVCRC